MADKKKFQVQAEDQNGDVWVVRSDRKDSADGIAKQFRDQGMKNVTVTEVVD